MQHKSIVNSHLFEIFQIPFVVLAGPVSWKVCGCLVADNFSANLKLLLGCEQKLDAKT